MATDERVELVSYEADADLSAKQYLFAELSADGQVDAVDSQGAATIGVIYTNPDTAGQPVSVALPKGKVKVKYGDTIAIDAEITTGADGRAETAGSGDFVCARACVAGVDGDIGTIQFIAGYIKA